MFLTEFTSPYNSYEYCDNSSRHEHVLSITSPLRTYSKHKQSPKLLYTNTGVYTSWANKFCTVSPYTLGPQYGICLISLLWLLEFGGGSLILENLWAPALQSVANMIVHTRITKGRRVMGKICSKLTATNHFALNLRRMNKHKRFMYESHGTGFNSRTTKHMKRPIMAIPVQPCLYFFPL